MSKIKLKLLEIEVYGASHADKIGVVIKGVPKGVKVDSSYIQNFVDLRKANNSIYSTKRIEEDKVEIESGIENGEVTGDISCVIRNKNFRSNDYINLTDIPRPSHADYAARKKYGDTVDLRGGGKYSGRMTACYCIAGAIAKEQLEKEGIIVKAYVSSIGKVDGKSYKDTEITKEMLDKITYPFPLLDERKMPLMQSEILQAAKCGDSVGGTIECVILDCPIGLGDGMFDGFEGELSNLMFSIPAVKGVEFGDGFNLSKMRGSIANDQFFTDGKKVFTYTNHNGGINGGITNGMPITFRVAIKPTPSISMPQKSVDLKSMTNTQIKIEGRHDACITPRAAIVVEAMANLYLYDLILGEKK